MSPICWIVAFFSLSTMACAGPRAMSEALERAIERTKQFQSTDRDRLKRPTLTQSALRAKAIQPVRMQRLDVERLNLLIKTIDKAWTLPKQGSMEPVGSNFQYKKTCASIQRARPTACEQLGFGIMCFNYCYEQGEGLEFKCEDASDTNFCEAHSNYENSLAKYKKDAYRAKAYIHQQLTRCYHSSICNGALLNVTLLKSANNFAQAAPIHLRVLKNRRRQLLSPTSFNMSAEMDHLFQERAGQIRQKGMIGYHAGKGPAESNENVLGKKYIPIWRRLLVRKQEEEEAAAAKAAVIPPSVPLTVEEEDHVEEERWIERRFGKKTRPTKAHNEVVPWRSSFHIPLRSKESEEKEDRDRPMNGDGEPVGFWNKFQPGKWFRSIHITNTG